MIKRGLNMNLFELFLIALSLSMDAFSISICLGMQNNNKGKIIIAPIFFGLFQALMPIIGYNLGNLFSEKIIKYNPYISTILLIVIGILMILEKNDEKIGYSLKIKELLALSIATSIDALVIGISLSFLKNNIIISSLIIGIITFIVCFIGYKIGNLLNKKIGKYSNLIGGITLIIIGIKIFIENTL